MSEFLIFFCQMVQKLQKGLLREELYDTINVFMINGFTINMFIAKRGKLLGGSKERREQNAEFTEGTEGNYFSGSV